jgi:hypothetical protein
MVSTVSHPARNAICAVLQLDDTEVTMDGVRKISSQLLRKYHNILGCNPAASRQLQKMEAR